jgi:hypothetical protein
VRKLPIALVSIPLLSSLSTAALAQSTTPAEPPPLAPAPPPAPTSESSSPATPPAPPRDAPAMPAPMDLPPGQTETSSPVELMSLRLMREKGLISKAEYESALHDLSDSTGQLAASQESVVFGRWATTLYGFIEGDMIYDSTRSLIDVPGGTLIARAGTPTSPSAAGDNSRFTFGVRNTRLGIRMKAPEFHGVRVTGTLESDFLGNQPGVQTGPYPGTTNTTLPSSPYTSEGAYLTNPTFRIRHANLKLETPVVDFLFGQYWQLFGWGPVYQPNSVEIQGLPGEIYARTPQLRISKTAKSDAVSFEVAVAAVRPVQRDGGLPDGEAGLRFAVNSWTGAQTNGSTGSTVAPLSIAATGLLRQGAVKQFAVNPKYTNNLTLSAIAVDAFLPVIPGTKENKDNSFSFNGEFSTGYGYADMFTSTNFGVGFPTPAGAGFTTTPTSVKAAFFSPDIDPGIVTYDANGHLHGIQITGWLFGAQYYLPGVDGKIWISGNYSHQQSANSHDYGFGGTPLYAQDWFDVNLFFDPVPAVRVGLEYANTNDCYVDGIHSINHRGQISGFFLF